MIFNQNHFKNIHRCPSHTQERQGYHIISRLSNIQVQYSESRRVEEKNRFGWLAFMGRKFFFPTFFPLKYPTALFCLSVVYQLLVDEALDELIDDFSPRLGCLKTNKKGQAGTTNTNCLQLLSFFDLLNTFFWRRRRTCLKNNTQIPGVNKK